MAAFNFMKRRLKKSHYNSGVSLHEAPTKKEMDRYGKQKKLHSAINSTRIPF